MIRLVDVDDKNIWKLLALKVSDEQVDYVANNWQSVVEAYLTVSKGKFVKIFGIYDDQLPVGFVMIGKGGYSDDCPKIYEDSYNLWRLMIDEKYQNKGYGRKAIELVLSYIRTLGDKKYCYLSYERENEKAKQIYQSFGFKETGDFDDEEVVALLEL